MHEWLKLVNHRDNGQPDVASRFLALCTFLQTLNSGLIIAQNSEKKVELSITSALSLLFEPNKNAKRSYQNQNMVRFTRTIYHLLRIPFGPDPLS